jgi:hypothetical protein
MPTHTCVEDLRRQYMRRVPRMFVDYAESGSYQERSRDGEERNVRFRAAALRLTPLSAVATIRHVVRNHWRHFER